MHSVAGNRVDWSRAVLAQLPADRDHRPMACAIVDLDGERPPDAPSADRRLALHFAGQLPRVRDRRPESDRAATHAPPVPFALLPAISGRAHW